MCVLCSVLFSAYYYTLTRKVEGENNSILSDRHFLSTNFEETFYNEVTLRMSN